MLILVVYPIIKVGTSLPTRKSTLQLMQLDLLRSQNANDARFSQWQIRSKGRLPSPNLLRRHYLFTDNTQPCTVDYCIPAQIGYISP